MHLPASYTTAPISVLCMAPTGQAATQAGSRQCRHCLRTIACFGPSTTEVQFRSDNPSSRSQRRGISGAS